MYFHEQLKRFKESGRTHVLKNDLQNPSELLTEKISFLESLYQDNFDVLEDPPYSERDLQKMIDIAKQQVKSSSQISSE